MTVFATDAERWDVVQRREAIADGDFVYGVASTGVYCRPGCHSRLPRRENVRFFDSWEDAEEAGFRACKRCQPREEQRPSSDVEAVIRACRLIESAEGALPLRDLGQAVGLSPAYLRRVFKEALKITPKQYAVEQRLGRVRDRLQTAATVTDAIYEAGYGSSSRFYENVSAMLGMAPTEYRQGGRGLRIRRAAAPCSLGWVLLAATERGVCAVDFADSPEELEQRLREQFPQAELVEGDTEFEAWVTDLLCLIDEPTTRVDLPLDIRGTAFQRRVWLALREIPPGSTATYSEVAGRIGLPKGARAVAGACAANRIAVAIPCHRVIRKNGGLGGYRWGLERKERLLARESGQAKE